MYPYNSDYVVVMHNANSLFLEHLFVCNRLICSIGNQVLSKSYISKLLDVNKSGYSLVGFSQTNLSLFGTIFFI